MKLVSTLVASLAIIASAAAHAAPSIAMEESAAAAAAAANTTAANATAPAVLHPDWKYAYNPPRVNPEYCQGFQIEHPTQHDLVYEAGSPHLVKWSVNLEGLKDIPLRIFRIRVISEGQQNFLTSGEYIPLYNDKEKKTGSAIFPLDVDGPDGMYHDRIMVTYSNQPVNCVFETVNFKIVHGPKDKIAEDFTPYLEESPALLHSTVNLDELYTYGNETVAASSVNLQF